MYKIVVYNAWTGEDLFVVFRHSEEEAEHCANYWWSDITDTRATFVKVN